MHRYIFYIFIYLHLLLFYVYEYFGCMYVSVPVTWNACGGQKRELDPL